MKHIRYEQKKYGGVLTICRPQALNALNSQILTELEEILENLTGQNLKCLVITGEGTKAFAAGADIGEMQKFSPEEAYLFGEKGKSAFDLLEKFPAPVIGAVNGYALGGGCELALCCDIRLCSEDAVFGQPEVSLGIIPGFGGTQRLARLIGTARAKEMIYTGKNISAAEALRIGLVNAVYPGEELEDQVEDLAERIAGNAFAAVKFCKRAIDQGIEKELSEGLEIESRLFAECFDTKEQKERMQAFLERGKKR